jgi:hypothetical protein
LLHQYEDQLAAAMRSVPPDRRDLFLRNFEILISLPLPFDAAVAASIWSVLQDEAQRPMRAARIAEVPVNWP